ncbi:hypothetical protein NJF54_08475 [Pseudomonas guariconensis]|uniref:hypothetical protein n=1 Tax=Pseudomonas TaxID=286 RepID=UPI001CE4A817|nr:MULTISPECIES: hypothetical protein [Pseudomonas]MCO7631868.1 hypothetical protein [Pseudomonas guariconensis]
MNTRSVAFARSRLRTLGAFSAFLAWATAAVEFTATPMLWWFDYPDVLAAYLQAFGEQMPLLLAPSYQPSHLAMGLVFGLELVPVCISVLALALIGLFFMRVSQGQTWTTPNIKLLWRVGLLCICLALTWPVIETLQGLALAIDLPAGERSFGVSIGVSSGAVYEIMRGILLCAFSLLMHDAKTLSDEHNCYV